MANGNLSSAEIEADLKKILFKGNGGATQKMQKPPVLSVDQLKEKQAFNAKSANRPTEEQGHKTKQQQKKEKKREKKREAANKEGQQHATRGSVSPFTERTENNESMQDGEVKKKSKKKKKNQKLCSDLSEQIKHVLNIGQQSPISSSKPEPSQIPKKEKNKETSDREETSIKHAVADENEKKGTFGMNRIEIAKAFSVNFKTIKEAIEKDEHHMPDSKPSANTLGELFEFMKPSPEVLEELEKDFIFPLKKRSTKFPKAQFFCRLCEYHCDTVNVSRNHAKDTRHRRLKQLRAMDTILRHIAPPSHTHLAALAPVLDDVYRDVVLTKELIDVRKDAVRRLEERVQQKLSEVHLRLYGSSVNGFGLKSSDVNIDVVLPEKTNPATALIGIFELVQNTEYCYSDIKSDFMAKVPSIYLTTEEGLKCRLTVHNDLPWQTSQLLQTYACIDSRVAKLGVLFKYWAKLCKIDRQDDGSLPTYAFSLLTVYFLQQLKPPVLPVLHEISNTRRGNKGVESEHCYCSDLEKINKLWKTTNTQSVAELWIDMLKFYSLDLDMANTVVSIRQFKSPSRAQKKWSSKKLAIEDPFSTKRNVTRSVSHSQIFEYIYDCIRSAYHYFGLPQTKDGPVVKLEPIQDKEINSNMMDQETVNTPHSSTDAQSEAPKDEVSLKQVQPESMLPACDCSKTERSQSLEMFASCLVSEVITNATKTASEMQEKHNIAKHLNTTYLDNINLAETMHKFTALSEVCLKCAIERYAGDFVNEVVEQSLATLQRTIHSSSSASVPDLTLHLTQTGEHTGHQKHDSSSGVSEQNRMDASETIGKTTSDCDSFNVSSVADLSTSCIASCNTDSDVDTPNAQSFAAQFVDSVISGVVKKYSVESVGVKNNTDDDVVVDDDIDDDEWEDIEDDEDEDEDVVKHDSTDKEEESIIFDDGVEGDELVLQTVEANDTQHRSSQKSNSSKTDSSLQLKLEDFVFKFDAETLAIGKGPSMMCSICQKEGHLKISCPEEQLPMLQALPPMTEQHERILNDVLMQVPYDFAPTEREVKQRNQILQELEDFIQDFYPDAKLCLFGSSCNGFGFQYSDLDICLTFLDHVTAENLDCVAIIDKLAKKLKFNRGLYNIIPITTAKVPIVKFKHRKSQLEGDISLYNILAQHNTRLLLTYANLDPRVTILGYTMKVFAKICDIGDASRGSLSSYAYILMVLYYLQQRKPPVIPVLQELHDQSKPKPEVLVDGYNAWFHDGNQKSLKKMWKEYNTNKESVAELWLGLLRFYTEEFKYNEHVVCIRQIKPLTRFEKMWNGKCIAIEDPFDLNHNLGAGLSRKMHTYIMKAFINGRTRFGVPVHSIPHLFKTPQDYFFSVHHLTDGRPPNDRGCRVCGKIGHFAKECPILLARKEREQQQRDRSRDKPKPDREHTSPERKQQNHNDRNQHQASDRGQHIQHERAQHNQSERNRHNQDRPQRNQGERSQHSQADRNQHYHHGKEPHHYPQQQRGSAPISIPHSNFRQQPQNTPPTPGSPGNFFQGIFYNSNFPSPPFSSPTSPSQLQGNALMYRQSPERGSPHGNRGNRMHQQQLFPEHQYLQNQNVRHHTANQQPFQNSPLQAGFQQNSMQHIRHSNQGQPIASSPQSYRGQQSQRFQQPHQKQQRQFFTPPGSQEHPQQQGPHAEPRHVAKGSAPGNFVVTVPNEPYQHTKPGNLSQSPNRRHNAQWSGTRRN